MSGRDWQRVHEELTRLARSRATLDAEEASWLVEAVRVRVHEPLACGTLLEYLERVLGYGPRLAKERLRVAEALSMLTRLRESLATGELHWSAVREISRVATPATEAEWIAAARGKTVRQIEEMVSGHRRGDRPGDPADPSLRRHVLRLEISADALAAFRDARRHLELEVGHSLEDDEMVRMLAHCALDSGRDPGRAAYQVAMTVCTECRRGTRDGAGQVFAVESHHVDAALCDAQQVFIDSPASAPETMETRLEAQAGVRENPSSATSRRNQADAQDGCVPDAATDTFVASNDLQPWSEEFEIGRPSQTHVGQRGESISPTSRGIDQPAAPRPTQASRTAHASSLVPATMPLVPATPASSLVPAKQASPLVPATMPLGPAKQASSLVPATQTMPLVPATQTIPLVPATQTIPLVPAATQTIPPRIRRLVWRRDHRRCTVPGCRAAQFLEIHHLVPLAEGGDHDPTRLLLLCSAHHTRVHGGRLRIEGRAPDRLVFTHANGAPFGQLDRALGCYAPEAPSHLGCESGHGMEADAVAALRCTGVSVGDARRAVAEAAQSRPTAIEELLRRAFVILGRTVYASRVSEVRARYSVRNAGCAPVDSILTKNALLDVIRSVDDRGRASRREAYPSRAGRRAIGEAMVHEPPRGSDTHARHRARLVHEKLQPSFAA
jgi:hypothetical protein